MPIDAIDGILEAFRSHAIVAVSEGNHGNEQFHAFRLALIRDPRFPLVANDIVVESGNARYQAVMDQFVRGDDVPADTLRKVWQDTTQAEPVWDLPIYEEFYRAVRALNQELPPHRRLRVLLGDPPVDWRDVHSFSDLNRWFLQRDRYPADAIRREVLATERRALVIYGDGHLWRNIPRSTIVSFLETAPATSVFTVATPTDADWTSLQADIESWRTPSLAMVRDTMLGALGFTSFYRRPGPANPWRTLRMEDESDAVLYLGPASTITTSRLPPALCADPAYRQMRLARMRLDGSPSQSQIERFARYCRSR